MYVCGYARTCVCVCISIAFSLQIEDGEMLKYGVKVINSRAKKESIVIDCHGSSDRKVCHCC